MTVKVRMVVQKERGVVVLLIAPILQQYIHDGHYKSPDAICSFCFAMAAIIDGRKNAPGKLERMKYARSNTATLKLTAGVNPATLDIKNVNESSCKPWVHNNGKGASDWRF